MVDCGFQFGGIVVYWRKKFETMEVRKMKFSEIRYERVDLEARKVHAQELLQRLQEAACFDELER